MFVLVFVLPNGAIRKKIPPFDSAYEIVLTDVKYKHKVVICSRNLYFKNMFTSLAIKVKHYKITNLCSVLRYFRKQFANIPNF
jgi:hypothetical protein